MCSDGDAGKYTLTPLWLVVDASELFALMLMDHFLHHKIIFLFFYLFFIYLFFIYDKISFLYMSDIALYLFINSFINLFIYLFINLFIYFVYRLIFIFIFIFISVYLSINIFTSVYIYLYVYLFIYVFIYTQIYRLTNILFICSAHFLLLFS